MYGSCSGIGGGETMKIVFFMLLVMLLVGNLMPVAAQSDEDCNKLQEQMLKAQTKLNDWAELNRYSEANLKLLPPKKGENRVVFIGDSITDLWDEKGFGGFFPGKPYINRGISGQTTPQILLRFRQDVVRLDPKIVVILAGTNDLSGNTGPMTIDQSYQNLISMAELATANRVKVVFSSVLPVSDRVSGPDGEPYLQTAARPPAKILELNELLKKYANIQGYTYLDYYSEMAGTDGFIRDGITFDGLHPNAKGYEIMRPLAEQAIASALKSKK